MAIYVPSLNIPIQREAGEPVPPVPPVLPTPDTSLWLILIVLGVVLLGGKE